MDLEVVGRHALLFDDDNLAAFVNSPDALVEWNSLSIDRYDVRHLLSGPPPPRSRRNQHRLSPLAQEPFEAELDHERYLDLTSPSDSQDKENEAELENIGGYHAVPLSYGNPSESADQKSTDAESCFRPPFSVPEYLLQNLPTTERVHQIIARTASFVSKHGGQTEIVLRVKQGDNPTFRFLMPDHELHPYFRFLVDHQELLKSSIDAKSIEEENREESGIDQASTVGGALSLLGSVYGTEDDEDGTTIELDKNNTDKAVTNAVRMPHGSETSADNTAVKHESGPKSSVPPPKEKVHVIKRNRSISTIKAAATAVAHKEGDSLVSVSSTADKFRDCSSSGLSKAEPYVIEPPSDLKRVVDKIVEFIIKNGKEFEAVLVQQDSGHGRFPFLLPSNKYHPYYLKVLQKAQESGFTGKGFIADHHDSSGHGKDKKVASKESDTFSSDIPYEFNRKEKFKMVLGKSKEDGQEPSSKGPQPQVGVSVDAASAAAILQAATRGIKKPNLELLSKITSNGNNQAYPSGEGKEPTFSSSLSSWPEISTQKLGPSGESGVSVPEAKAIAKTVPEAKAIAKTAAIAAASEADSSEASLTREQKLKAERLKRAKFFAAMIKGGSAPLKGEPPRSLSVEPPETGFFVSGVEIVNNVTREREGSSVPLEVDTSDKVEKYENKESADSYNERRSKRTYRLRSKGEEEEEEEENVGAPKEDRDHKHSRKKRRSHYSSHHSRDRHKHRKRHSSSKDRDSHHRHKHSRGSDDELPCSRHQDMEDSSSDDMHGHTKHKRRKQSTSDDEDRHSRHRRKKDRSLKYERRHSRHSKRHDTLSDEEDKRSRHKAKQSNSSDDEHRHRSLRDKHGSSSDYKDRWCSQRGSDPGSSSDGVRQNKIKAAKHRKMPPTERDDLEEGEILTKSDQSKASEGIDGPSREASVDLSKSYQDVRATSQPSETADIPDDLRAKIRAMLMATL